MKLTVRIPTQLRETTGGQAEVILEADTVKEALFSLQEKYPEIKDRLFDSSGELRRFVNIFLSDEDIRYLDGLETGIKDGDVLSIVPAVAGGAIALETAFKNI